MAIAIAFPVLATAFPATLIVAPAPPMLIVPVTPANKLAVPETTLVVIVVVPLVPFPSTLKMLLLAELPMYIVVGAPALAATLIVVAAPYSFTVVAIVLSLIHI